MTDLNFSALVPGHTLNIDELSRIYGGADIKTDEELPPRACDSGACSSKIELSKGHCTQSICRSGA